MKMILTRYSRVANSLATKVGRRMIVLLVGGVAKCFEWPKRLRIGMGRRLNPKNSKFKTHNYKYNSRNILADLDVIRHVFVFKYYLQSKLNNNY